jgi:hypothetical protein
MEFERFPAQPTGGSAFGMGQMASALPDYRSPPFGAFPGQQPFNISSVPNPATLYQYAQASSLAGQARSPHDQPFVQPFPTEYPHGQQSRQMPPSYGQPSAQHANLGPNPQQFAGQQYFPYQQGQPPNYQPIFQQPGTNISGHSAINPYGQAYFAGDSSAQPTGQMRQEDFYLLTQPLQPGSEQGLPGSSRLAASYSQTAGQGMFLRLQVLLSQTCDAT